jgi:hypothetical protein
MRMRDTYMEAVYVSPRSNPVHICTLCFASYLLFPQRNFEVHACMPTPNIGLGPRELNMNINAKANDKYQPCFCPTLKHPSSSFKKTRVKFVPYVYALVKCRSRHCTFWVTHPNGFVQNQREPLICLSSYMKVRLRRQRQH